MQAVLWDFDGVILDSMKVRDEGFQEIFCKYEDGDVKKLIQYHRLNGGLSRYVKIRFFYEKVLEREISEEKVLKYAEEFSSIMRVKLIDPENLIKDSVDFIKANYRKIPFHIVSGSDQAELRFICKELGISNYFKSIHGSPTAKKTLVKNVILKFGYNASELCLIGDSINDFEAANVNGIKFYGYNNEELSKTGISMNYLKSLKNLDDACI